MKIDRDWATPMVIGCFALMATTGVLMFFEIDSGMNKLAHEWFSWLMITGVALHASVNWQSFKRHVTGHGRGHLIVVGAVVVIGASFVRLPGQRGDATPAPLLALRAVTAAPLGTVAPLAGQAPEALVAALQAAGIPIVSAKQSIDSVVGSDRERESRALQVLFPTQHPFAKAPNP